MRRLKGRDKRGAPRELSNILPFFSHSPVIYRYVFLVSFDPPFYLRFSPASRSSCSFLKTKRGRWWKFALLLVEVLFLILLRAQCLDDSSKDGNLIIGGGLDITDRDGHLYISWVPALP